MFKFLIKNESLYFLFCFVLFFLVRFNKILVVFISMTLIGVKKEMHFTISIDLQKTNVKFCLERSLIVGRMI